jgi:hypothetical protein
MSCLPPCSFFNLPCVSPLYFSIVYSSTPKMKAEDCPDRGKSVTKLHIMTSQITVISKKNYAWGGKSLHFLILQLHHVLITKFKIKTKKIRSIWIWVLLAWSAMLKNSIVIKKIFNLLAHNWNSLYSDALRPVHL